MAHDELAGGKEHLTTLKRIMKTQDESAVQKLVTAMAADLELAKAVGDLVAATVQSQDGTGHIARHGSQVLVTGPQGEAADAQGTPTSAPTTAVPAVTPAPTTVTPAPTTAIAPTSAPTTAVVAATPLPSTSTLAERLKDGGQVVMGHMGFCESRYGFCTNVAENTLDAAKKCLGLCDGIEIDVAQSSDGHWILMHDEDARRVTDIDPSDNTWVRNMPWEKLKKLNVVSIPGRAKRKCDSPYNCPDEASGSWVASNHYEGPPVPIGEFEPVVARVCARICVRMCF